MRGPNGEYPIPVHVIYKPLAKANPLFDVDTEETSEFLGSFRDALLPATRGFHPWPLVLATPATDFFELLSDTDGLQWWRSEFNKVEIHVHNVEDILLKMRSTLQGLLRECSYCLDFVSRKEDVYKWAQENSLTEEQVREGRVSPSYP